jgi:dephospho-CoA kinase
VSLIYISGVSATGKSTLLNALSLRGFKTYDTDNCGLASWYSKRTGKLTQRPAKAADRTDEWYANHSWRLSKERVEAVAKEATNSTVFMCGSTLSDIEVWDMFAKVICLTIDESTLRRRLLNRTSNDWGKAPAEFNHVLRWREPWEKRNRELGADMIDATQPINDVVAAILEATKDKDLR